MGPEMMQRFREQAERFGTRFITDDVTRIEFAEEDGGIHRVYVGDQEFRTRAVILSMGAEPKKLGVPGEDEFASRGVSYCATCDAAFFRDHNDDRGRRRRHGHGGGDLPGEVRRQGHDRPQAQRLPRLGDHGRPRARDREHRVPDPVRGRALRAVARTARSARRSCATSRTARSWSSRSTGAFIGIGHKPNSSWSAASSTLDDEGYLQVEGELDAHRRARACSPRATSPTTIYRQAVTAAGTGCMAALDAEAYLRDTPVDAEAHWAPDVDKVEAAAERAASG